MIHFELNEKEYQFPENWDEVTLGQYVNIGRLQEERLDYNYSELYLLKQSRYVKSFKNPLGGRAIPGIPLVAQLFRRKGYRNLSGAKNSLLEDAFSREWRHACGNYSIPRLSKAPESSL